MQRLAILLLLLCTPAAHLAAEDYVLGADSQRHAGVPRGAVTQHTWTSNIYPGTVRDYWIYVPAQYAAGQPACLMVFQDGGGWWPRQAHGGRRWCSTT